jgi:prepilin-type N-terminal cleavage/methylation domain-containing protein
MAQTVSDKRQRGTSMVELLVVVAILTIVTGFAVPSISTVVRTYRISGDARSIAYTLNLARMRAAADYTHGRAYMDLSSNAFHVEVWNKAGGCWQTDGDSNPCTQATSPVTLLAEGNTFGFGAITAGPTAQTTAIAQAPDCKTGVGGAAPGADIANTACIEFNSSGFTVDSTNTIVASDAIYITNGGSSYVAVAVPIAGQPRTYNYNGSAWALF